MDCGCADGNQSGPEVYKPTCQNDTIHAWLGVQALGDDTAAQQHKQEADKILRELTATVPPEGPLRAKFVGLQAFIQQIG